MRETGGVPSGPRTSWSARALATILALLVVGAGACGTSGSGDEEEPEGTRVTVWILENEPDRVRATRANVDRFTRQTGIGVELVAVGDDELASRVAQAEKDGRLPDVAQLPLGSVHTYAARGLLDETAAEDVVDRLDDDSFSQTALTLVSREGRIAAVPSDGWGQLLIYRKDLFGQAGLEPPETLEDVRRAARRLHREGRAGIALANVPGDTFTAESFEHLALAADCQLVDDAGTVTLDSAPCRSAFAVYAELAGRYSPGGVLDADRTRDAYFAGRAAMILWSPFLLDAMAGLRDDARPTCPECREDPAFLARNSGLVGALSSRGGAPAQYGEIASWGLFHDEDTAPAKRFVEYMLSDGYLRWLALSPQGKYPVRAGDGSRPQRFFDGWEALESGVERKAPLRRFYSETAIQALRDGAGNFQRWGFPQERAALTGALRQTQPVAGQLAAAIAGEQTPDQAAQRARAAVERIQRSLGGP